MSLARIRLYSWVRAPVLAAVLLLVLVTLSTQGTTAYYDRLEGGGDEDWRGANSHVLSQWQSGDAMLFYTPWLERNFKWYNWRWDLEKQNRFTLAVPGDEWRDMVDEDVEPDKDKLVQRISNDHQRVWLVLSHAGGERRAMGESIESALEHLYQEREDKKFNGIRIALFSEPKPFPSGEELTYHTTDERDDPAVK